MFVRVQDSVGEGIPVINLQLNSKAGTGQANRKQVVNEVYHASQKAPFFFVTNHGIAEEDIASLWKAQENLFRQPKEVKKQVAFDTRRFVATDSSILGDQIPTQISC